MRRSALLLAAACCGAGLAGTTDARAQSAGLPDLEGAGLTWAKLPSIREMARLYPVRARVQRVMRGQATVACTSDARGRLDCESVGEAPTGMFFGPAAVRVMEQARVRSNDGQPVEGRRFGYTLKFGNWPASRLADKWHPVEAGLRWVDRPVLANSWDMSGQSRDEVLAASFSCTAQADGGLDCAVKEPARDQRFTLAAARSLEQAKVRTVNGDSPQGRSFDWTLKVIRASGCLGGGQLDQTEPAAQVQIADNGNEGSSSVDVNAEGLTSDGPFTRFRNQPACRPAMLQTR